MVLSHAVENHVARTYRRPDLIEKAMRARGVG
jgi:hypothetical protein